MLLCASGLHWFKQKQMTRPNLPLEGVIALVKQAGFNIAEQVYIVGIRGYYLNTMGQPGVNDIGIYDDALFLVSPDIFIAVNGNTDPSKQTPGIAKLIPGVHYYKIGDHHIGDPAKRYPAFRPASADESVPVTREGETGIFKGIAINIHRGGINSTSSLGCQTVYPDEWLNFQETAYAELKKYGLEKRFPYILVEQK